MHSRVVRTTIVTCITQRLTLSLSLSLSLSLLLSVYVCVLDTPPPDRLLREGRVTRTLVDILRRQRSQDRNEDRVASPALEEVPHIASV